MKAKEIPTDAQWVRRWIRQYGIQKVRDGLIAYVLDRISGDEWEALRTRLEMGQVALASATAKQLTSELADWSIGSSDDELTMEEYERVEKFIRPKLEGDAVATKEGMK
jgi:hypothetical protein